MQLRHEGLTWHVTGQEVVVLDLKSSVYLKVNGSGRLLWERLAEPCTEPDLIAVLVEQYDVDESRATDDVRMFVAELRRRQLLKA